MLALLGDEELDEAALRGALAVEPGHTTPKLDVRGVVVRDDEVLLCRELLDGGRWTLPGGWADPGEPPSVAVTREVQEETGLVTEARAVLALLDRSLHNTPPTPFSTWKLFVECVPVGGALLARTDETADARYWPVDDLPEMSDGRVTAAQVRRCHALCRDPDAPRVAVFD